MAEYQSRAVALLAIVALCVTVLPPTPVSSAALQEVRDSEPGVGPAAIYPAAPLDAQARVLVEGGEHVRCAAGALIVRFAPEVAQVLAAPSLAGEAAETGVPALDRLGAEQGLRAIEPVFRQRARALARAAAAGQPAAPSLGDAYLLRFPAEADVEALAAAYQADPAVVYAEPDYAFEFDGQPDDPSFGQQWYLHNTGQYRLADADVDAPEAWDIVTGTETIVIAVIDTGIDRDHPDLDDKMWTNPGETPDNGVDDDGNGYVDDVWGWNWVSDASDPDDYEPDDPRDDNGHGTHVAGIAAAETDNATGVAGMCWNCGVMALKAFESNGVGTTSDIVQAIDYAADKGADVINMSFGTYAESLLLEDTLAAAYGAATLVAAAGNYGTNKALATAPYYPAAYPYVLGVGATDVGCVERDPITLACLLVAEHRASFSNYGVNADVGAPGVSIYATFPGGAYASLSGTSMAAPVVSGLAALLLSHNPGWSRDMARAQIVKTADAIYTGAYPFTAVGSGRANAYSALTVAPTPDLALLGGSLVYGDGSGDGDGLPDAGETFTLTLALKNYWGEAAGTSAVLSTSDPYVTLLDDTASFGDISAYATMRNGASPFEMALDSSAPNNHQVDLSLDVTANSGAYSYSTGFSFLVQRGIEIPDPLFPAVITQSMTLDSDYLYIVKQNMLVQQGITLTIEPGTRLQFDPDRFIKVEGTLVASGTEALPIYFTSNQKDPQPGDFKGIVFSDTATDAVLDGSPVLTTAVKTGDPTPLGGQFITFTTPAMMNKVGDIVFGATISGGTAGAGLFRWLRGHVQPVVAAGETAPDTGGAAFASFREAAMDNSGDVTFVAELSDGRQGVFAGDEIALEKIAATDDVVLNGTTPLTLTTFNYITTDSAGNIAFRAGYEKPGGTGTRAAIFIYRPDLGAVSPVMPSLGWPFYEYIDVGAPHLPDPWETSGGNYQQYVRFAIQGTSSTGLLEVRYFSDIDEYQIDRKLMNGDTLANGDALSFSLHDRVVLVPDASGAEVSFTAHNNTAGVRGLFSCGNMEGCASSGVQLMGDGDPAPDGRTLQFTETVPYVSTGVEVVYNANLSGTAGLDFGIVVSDAHSLVSLVEEGDALPGGGTVAAIANVSVLPHASRIGTVAAIVDVAGAAPGEQRLLLVDQDDTYTSGSVLNHVVLAYGGGILIEDSSPLLINSSIRQCSGVPLTGEPSPKGAVVVSGGGPVLRNCWIGDNATHGLWAQDNKYLILRESTLHNNVPSYPTVDWNLGAGFTLLRSQGAILMDNVIEYNQTQSGGAGRIQSTSALLQGSTIRRNLGTYAGGGFLVVDGGVPVFRFNTFTGNVGRYGYEPSSGIQEWGGSAVEIVRSSAAVAYNTILGNHAEPGPSPRTLPGVTVHYSWMSDGELPNELNHNNIVGNDSTFDAYLSNIESGREDVDATQNYWGTTDANEIRYDRIYDYWQDFEPGEATFQPFLTTPEPLAPGFLLDATTTPPDPIGAEVMTVTLDFSKDMNTAVTPTVTFGVDEPYTQHAVEDVAWVSPTRWVGTFDVTVDTGDGINTLTVGGAEDVDGMEIPEDTRFQFVIQTAGTSAVLLEAVAGVGEVALTWTQNDVTDLAGYILYRSPYTNTDYSQIGGSMFVSTVYTDTDVTNGVPYYYKYSVLDTDFNEVAWSNEVSVTPDDYTLPATPSVADDGDTTHYFDRLHATWSSADPETGIAEYHYCIGTAAGACDTISWTSMGTLTETTKTGLSLVDGETYHVNVKARNGADHWSEVGASDGITVDKLPPPAVSAVHPISGVRTVDVTLTLTGTGFTTSTARLGSHELAGLTVVSPTLMTATVPANDLPAGVYTLTVTNFDTQTGIRTHAYTATNPIQGPRPLLFTPATRQVGDDETAFTVDIQVQDVVDLAAFQFDVTYDPAVVHVEDATLGAFLGSGGLSTVPLGPEIDNGTGRVTFGGFGYGTGSGATGSGTLATLTFSPQATGTTSLSFADEQLRDSANYEIPADPGAGQVQVVHYPFGDFDRDCDVDVADIMVVASRWNSHSGDPGYDPTYDFDADGDIDVADIMQVAVHWGATCGGTLLCCGGEPTEWAVDQAATVRVDPASRDVDTGATYALTVTVEDALDLGGFEFDLSFDPALLQVDDARLGGFLGSTGRNVGALGPEIDNNAGLLTYGAFSFGTEPGPDGAGVLAVVTYTTFLTPGVTSLDLLDVQLIDTSAGAQPAQAVSGSLTLLSGPRIGAPAFPASVASDEPLTVTVDITNTTSSSGVSAAALHYGYTVPYTLSSVAGSGPGGSGNGLWTFEVLPQGDGYEDLTLRFSLAAQDGDIPPGEMVDDNGGAYYAVTITDDDIAPPEFSNPLPAYAFHVFSVTLQVDITDTKSAVADDDQPDGSVYVAWDTDGELVVDAVLGDMDWLSGTTYALDTPIPPLTQGLTVTWQVYAEDDDNTPSGAWSALYETIITDTIFGDLDYDCDVDIDDIMIIVAHWNTQTGDPGYDDRYDFDGDGDIDVADVMMVAAVWGNTCGGSLAGRSPARPALTAEGADVFFVPSSHLVRPGEPFTVGIAISGTDDLAGFEFDFIFDSQAITVTGVHLGEFLGNSGNTAVALGPRAMGAGRVVAGGFSFGEQPGPSGGGRLVVLDLLLLKHGETTLSLEDVQLVASDATPAPLHSVGQGQIRTGAYIYLPLVRRNQ